MVQKECLLSQDGSIILCDSTMPVFQGLILDINQPAESTTSLLEWCLEDDCELPFRICNEFYIPMEESVKPGGNLLEWDCCR